MKKNQYIIALLFVTFLCSCEDFTISNPIYGTMGYRSIFTYQYMRYNADSAVLSFQLEEIESTIRHYNSIATYVDNQLIAKSDTFPYSIELPIPIIDDSVFNIKHICGIDTINSFRDTLIYPVYVHKSEIINPIPDTVTLIIERKDSIYVTSYNVNPKGFYWQDTDL